MVVGPAVLSTLATGLFLAVVVVTVTLAGRRRTIERPSFGEDSPLSVLTGPLGWVLGFLLAAAVVGLGGVVAVSDGGFLPGLGGELLPVVLGAIGALVGVNVFLGTYYAARTHGVSPALAGLASVMVLGFVVLGVVTVRLAGLF